MHKPLWMYFYKFNMKSSFHHCFVNYFLSFPASCHFVCFYVFLCSSIFISDIFGKYLLSKEVFFNDKVFPSSFFFLRRTPWGRQWIVIWHANIQSKEKKKKKEKTQSVLNKHTFPKSGRYTRTFTCIHAKKQRESNSKNKNENKQFLNSDLHDFFSTNRLFGKTDKH